MSILREATLSGHSRSTSTCSAPLGWKVTSGTRPTEEPKRWSTSEREKRTPTSATPVLTRDIPGEPTGALRRVARLDLADELLGG